MTQYDIKLIPDFGDDIKLIPDFWKFEFNTGFSMMT